jgi:hypothetical protein
MLFGTRFVWVTDCNAIWFILSCEGANPAILCLQRWLMCWDMDIVHRTNVHLTDADYWSRLSVDICFDPQFNAYLDFNRSLQSRFPTPVDLPMRPENMPNNGGPMFASPPSELPHQNNSLVIADATYCQSLLSSIICKSRAANGYFTNVPV